MIEFKQYQLEELCEITSSKRIFSREYVDEGVPFYRGKEITELYNGALDITTQLFITEEKYKEIEIAHGVPEVGDMLLTSVGTLGSTYLVTDTDRFYFKDGNLTWFRDFKGLDSRYLKLWLETKEGIHELQRSTIGAAQPAYTISNLKKVNIRIPSLSAQKTIADYFTNFEKLIENNTRRIAILEEMAKAIHTELMANERTNVVKLDELADINPESIKPKAAPSTINYVDIKSVSTGKIDNISEMPFSEAPSRARRIVKDGDIIWATVRPNRKQYSYVLNPVENTIVSTGFAVIRAKNVPSSFLYLSTTTELFAKYLENRATGAAYPAVKTDDFKDAEILLPSEASLTDFDEKVTPILRLSNNLLLQNYNLAAQRDLLLPKLIPGQIQLD